MIDVDVEFCGSRGGKRQCRSALEALSSLAECRNAMAELGLATFGFNFFRCISALWKTYLRLGINYCETASKDLESDVRTEDAMVRD